MSHDFRQTANAHSHQRPSHQRGFQRNKRQRFVARRHEHQRGGVDERPHLFGRDPAEKFHMLADALVRGLLFELGALGTVACD